MKQSIQEEGEAATHPKMLFSSKQIRVLRSLSVVVIFIAITYKVEGKPQQLGGGIFNTEDAMEYWKRR